MKSMMLLAALAPLLCRPVFAASQTIASLEKEARANPGSSEILMNLGWAYWHAHQLDKAEKCWQLLNKLDPKNPAFIRLMAAVEVDRGNDQKALSLADKALAMMPGDKSASLYRAKALIHLQRNQEALRVLNGILEKHPDYAPARLLLAEYLARTGRTRESLTYFDALVRSDPKIDAYHRDRADTLYQLGRFNAAMAEWKPLAERNPPDAHALQNMGRVYWENGRYEEAWKSWSRLLQLEPENPVFLGLLANAEIQRKNYEKAEELARRGLSISPDHKGLLMILAKALLHMQRDQEAFSILDKLLKQYRDDPKAKLFFAEALAQYGHTQESLRYIEQLAQSDPSNPLYVRRRAQVLEAMGRFDDADSEWAILAEKTPKDTLPLKRLVADAVNRRAWGEAEQWLNKMIGADPLSIFAWQARANVLEQEGKFNEAMKAADAWAATAPTSLEPYYFKAELMEKLQDWQGAQDAYIQVLQHNPNSERALNALARIAQAQGDYKHALEVTRKIHEETSTSRRALPYLAIQEAWMLADAGRPAKALRILRRVEADSQAPIPILLYHGISPTDRTDSVTAENFRKQMRTIRDMGYKTITVTDLDRFYTGAGNLPEKPIMIMFDDARADSFVNADPVLKEFDFKATMFVPTGELSKIPYHAGPKDLKRWRATGRWEMQSHGDEAHDPVPIDGEGHLGHFLANRIWLPEQNRVETVAEFRARVEKDYRESKRKLEKLFPGDRIIGFAYPFGDYGETDYSNCPEAIKINEAVFPKYYRYAFSESEYGINTAHTEPFRLKRYSMLKETSIEQMVKHLELDEPWVKAKMTEASIWVSEGQPGHALEIYDELKKHGVDQPELLADFGMAAEKDGNVYQARQLYAQASTLEPENDHFNALLEQSRSKYAPTAGTSAEGFSDSFARRSMKALARVGTSVGPAQLGAWAGKSHYSEIGVPSINGQEVGAQMSAFPSLRTELHASYARRTFLQGPSNTADNMDGGFSFPVLPELKASLSGGVGNVESAAAIGRGRMFRDYGGGFSWDPLLTWNATLNYQRFLFNDRNAQNDARAQLTKSVWRVFSVGYAFIHLDSLQRSAEYYTPLRLNQHMGLAGLDMPFGPRSQTTNLQRGQIKLQYGAGYGYQDTNSRSVQMGRAELSWRLMESLYATVQGQYSSSPNYISREFTAGLGMNF